MTLDAYLIFHTSRFIISLLRNYTSQYKFKISLSPVVYEWISCYIITNTKKPHSLIHRAFEQLYWFCKQIQTKYLSEVPFSSLPLLAKFHFPFLLKWKNMSLIFFQYNITYYYRVCSLSFNLTNIYHNLISSSKRISTTSVFSIFTFSFFTKIKIKLLAILCQ